MASPDVIISVTAQLAQYSATATVERIATMASHINPDLPVAQIVNHAAHSVNHDNQHPMR